MSVYAKIVTDIQGFGGHLECEICGRKESLGSTANKLSNGWPNCCG